MTESRSRSRKIMLTLLPAPKRTKLTPYVRHNNVIEHVKRMAEPSQLLKKIATEAQLRTC